MSDIVLDEDQRNAIKYLFSKQYAFCAMPAGDGKTIVALSVIKLFLAKNMMKFGIVFSHKHGVAAYKKNNIYGIPILYLEIPDDFEKLTDEAIRHIIQTDKVVVVNTSILNRYIEKVLLFLSYTDVMFIDEIHNYRNITAATSKALFRFCVDFTGRRYGMTATMFYTKIDDIFTAFSYIVPGVLGSHESFFNAYVDYETRPVNSFNYVNTPRGRVKIPCKRILKDIKGYKNIDVLNRIISQYIFSTLNRVSKFKIIYQNNMYSLSDYKEYDTILEGIDIVNSYKFSLTSAGMDRVSSIFSCTEQLKLLSGRLMRADQITKGTYVQYEGQVFRVSKITEELSEADVIQRLIPLQNYLSRQEVKYNKLKDLISKDKGILIYCTYHDTVSYLKERLLKDFPNKNIVILKGGDDNISKKVSLLSGTEIVLMTRVASQSLDFYFTDMVLFGVITNPGSLIQLFGRIQRKNSPHKELIIHFLLCEESVEVYFYERLLYMLSVSPYENLKKSLETTLSPEQVTQLTKYKEPIIKLLKQFLLWKKKSFK